MFTLAEIADKEPGLLLAAAAGFIAAGVAFSLMFVRRGLLFIPLGFVLFLNYVTVDELMNSVYGEIVIDELGWAFVVGRFLLFNLPIVLAIGLQPRILQHVTAIARRSANLCEKCGYDLRGQEGNKRCPECGRLG